MRDLDKITPEEIAADFTRAFIQFHIEYMEKLYPHDELPPIYDLWVKARDLAVAA